jgi:hypothetical protein
LSDNVCHSGGMSKRSLLGLKILILIARVLLSGEYKHEMKAVREFLDKLPEEMKAAYKEDE